LVTVRSQATLTFVVTLVLLFAALGSRVVAPTEEDAVIEAATTLGGTFTATTMSASAPTARLGLVQTTFPAVPTAGVVHVQPAGAATDWYVVFGGLACVKDTDVATAGPLFVMACV
jgi:hypothetical protein